MIYCVCSRFNFLRFCGHTGLGEWLVFFFSPVYNICCDMSCVKLYGKFNADSIQVHTASFMVHISSTPVVKCLIVIRAYLFKWQGNIKYHRFSAETGQWLSTDVCQLGNVHWSVWRCESLIGQMKQEHESGEVVSSWGWLKFPTTSVHIRRESGYINEMENLETGGREWQPNVANLTRVDFLTFNPIFRYLMSELIHTVKKTAR